MTSRQERVELASLIADLGERQHSIITRQQLLRAGATDSAIRHRISTGRLEPIHAGVYAIDGRIERFGRYMAAVLACDGVLSHRSNAALWELLPAPSGRIDVTVRRPGARRRQGIALHISSSMAEDDIVTRHGIPCASVARTLLDLAAVGSTRILDRALEQAQILRLYDHRAIEAVLARANGRGGAAALRRRVQDLADEPAPTRSELERRFLELVRCAGLPLPVVNGLVCGYEVDFHWPRQRLVVETDGRWVHGTQVAFERDRRRDLDLELAGWRVLRLTWRQVVESPGDVTAALHCRLRTNGANRGMGR